MLDQELGQLCSNPDLPFRCQTLASYHFAMWKGTNPLYSYLGEKPWGEMDMVGVQIQYIYIVLSLIMSFPFYVQSEKGIIYSFLNTYF